MCRSDAFSYRTFRPVLIFGLKTCELSRATGPDADSVPSAVQASPGEGDGPGAMLFHTTPEIGSAHRTILGSRSGAELVSNSSSLRSTKRT